MAPFCISVGVLVGPLSAVYAVLGPQPTPENAGVLRRRLRIAAPLLGSLAAVIGLVYLDAGGANLRDVLGRPDVVIAYSVRMTTDVLLLGTLGFDATRIRANWVYFLLFPAFVVAIGALLRTPTARRSVYLAIALIIFPLGMVVFFRTWMSYPLVQPRTLYLLFAQLGLSILVADAVGRLLPSEWTAGRFRWRHVGPLLSVAVILYLLHARTEAYIGG